MKLPVGVTFDTRLSQHFTRGNRRLNQISAIVIHWWNDPSAGATHAGVVSWFQDPRAQVSAHYTISGARVTRQVREKDIAWHARGGNTSTIGLELSPYQTDADYLAAAHVIADIWRRAGRRIPLDPHRSITLGTACPGTYDLARLQRLAIQVQAGGTQSRPATSQPKKQVTSQETKMSANDVWYHRESRKDTTKSHWLRWARDHARNAQVAAQSAVRLLTALRGEVSALRSEVRELREELQKGK